MKENSGENMAKINKKEKIKEKTKELGQYRWRLLLKCGSYPLRL